MKKTALIGIALIASALLSGCETNPALTEQLAKMTQSVKTGPAPASTPVANAVTTVPTAQNTTQNTANPIKSGGSTGLIGKTVTPKALPKNSDTRLTDYGNDYFDCGGSVLDGLGDNMLLTVMRKGLKTKCGGSKAVIAIMKSSNNNKTFEILDTVDVSVAKDYELSTSGCIGAQLAISKLEDVRMFTKHTHAWTIAGNKFVPVMNLKPIKCENRGFGAD